jgi:hypothetical protein
MRTMAIAFCITFASAAGPPRVHAQALENVDAQLADARYINDVGAGLTIAGLTSTALGAAFWLGLGYSGNGIGAIIAGPFFWCIGGPLGLAGIPTWIVGAIRSNILAANESERDRVAWSFELAGIVTTLAGIAVSLLGAALIIASFALVDGSGSRRHEVFAGTGGVLIPIGYFISTFIGTPLWAEAGRF